ncbi:MAG: cache domain-containing protein, partial [Candidatus Aminicenantes bacterium]|nr:cache domain-containing protein [Candidatus Aminicenantes bacterium]
AAERTFKKNIKTRVYEGHQAASRIYEKFRDSMSPEQVKKTIKETLRLFSFDGKRDYYFIKDVNNNIILYPPGSEFEDNPAHGDTAGNDPIRDNIDFIKSREEGFLSYDWYKPGQPGFKNRKITYFKLFKPFGWIIGSGEYMDELEKENRTGVLEWIKKLSFGKMGKYAIFAFEIENNGSTYRFDKMLIDPGDSRGTDRYLSDVFMGKRAYNVSKDILEKIGEKGEGTINIQEKNSAGKSYRERIIHVKLYAKWNWVVGAGFYPDESMTAMRDEKKKLEQGIKIEIFLIVMILGVVLFIAILISKHFSKMIKKEFNIFANFLKESVKENQLLDKSLLTAAEFQELADSANQMIVDKKKGEEALLAAKELAEAATRSKSKFLANMSHEIRTPMNAIIGMSDLLYQTEINEEQREYIAIINSSSNKLITIINDILDLSKIEAGKLDIEKTNFNLREIIEDVADITAIDAHKKDLELNIFLEPGIPIDLIGDSARLHQILLNLVNNAVKFTEKGEIVISARKEEEQMNQVKILFKVKDTGIGIPLEDKKKLFSPFSQIDAGATRKYGGSGLGL